MLNLLTDGSVDAVFCKTRAIGRCLAIQPKHPLSVFLFYLDSISYPYWSLLWIESHCRFHRGQPSGDGAPPDGPVPAFF